MFCPQCGAEFVDGKERCHDCDVALVDQPPTEISHQAEEYETVLETSDSSLIPLIKSVLDGARIPYMTSGEAMMNLFPSEALGALLHSSAGEMLIRVPKDRAEEARQLLEGEAELAELMRIGVN